MKERERESYRQALTHHSTDVLSFGFGTMPRITTQVKKRISELEATKDDEAFELEFDENGLPIRGEARPQTLTADRIAALQRRYGTEDASGEEKEGDDETRSVARSVLSENRGTSFVVAMVFVCMRGGE